MKKLALFFAAVFLSGWVTSTASALTISFGGVTPNPNDGSHLTTAISNADVLTFDSAVASPFTLSGDQKIVQGSIGGKYATPYLDTSKYLVVPDTTIDGNSTGTATINLTYKANYLGLYWGSIDTYNKIKFYNNGALVTWVNKENTVIDGVLGSDVFGPPPPENPDGSWTSLQANRYVNITGITFDRFDLIADGIAFEVDNIAVANVPEPATMLLLGLGLLGFAGARRKFKN